MAAECTQFTTVQVMSLFQRLKCIDSLNTRHRGRGGLEPEELKISNREMNRGSDWQRKEQGGRWGDPVLWGTGRVHFRQEILLNNNGTCSDYS